jgi:hypothetical protein
MFGEPLENRGKVPTYEQTYPDIVPIPDPITPDPITSEPVKPPFNLQGWWNNNHKLLMLLGIIVCLLILTILVR